MVGKMRYTADLSKQVENLFLSGKSVEEISVLIDRSKPSVISKLVSLGLYKKQPYTDKLGNLPTKKSDILKNLAAILDKDPNSLISLSKVNKNVLNLIQTSLS